MNLFRSLLPSPNRLFPFERLVIEATSSHLNPPTGARLLQQLAVVNKIQRHSRGKEVNLYRMQSGKPAFPDTLRFPHHNNDEVLSTVTLSTPHATVATLQAETHLVRGRLFSLLFSEPPHEFFQTCPATITEAKIAGVRIWLDPTQPETDQTTPSHPKHDLQHIDATLPDDYLELAQNAVSPTTDGITIYGLKEIRKIASPEANLLHPR